MNCRQKKSGGVCQNLAAYRFTWPGNPESFACEDCAQKLSGVAEIIGCQIQLIRLDLFDILRGSANAKTP